MLVLGFISWASRKIVIVFSGWWVFVPPALFLSCLPSSSTVRDAHFEWDSLMLNNFIGRKYNLIVSFFVTCPFLPSQISFSDRFANDSHCSIFSPYCWIILFIPLLLEHLGERLKKPFWEKRFLILLSKQQKRGVWEKQGDACRRSGLVECTYHVTGMVIKILSLDTFPRFLVYRLKTWLREWGLTDWFLPLLFLGGWPGWLGVSVSFLLCFASHQNNPYFLFCSEAPGEELCGCVIKSELSWLTVFLWTIAVSTVS